MHLLSLLRAQLDKNSVGTLALGEANRFREIFFEKEKVYLCSNHYTGNIDIRRLLESGLLGKTVPVEWLDSLLESQDLRESLLSDVLLEQGMLTEAEAENMARGQIEEELLSLLVSESESFHFHDGRVPESLLEERGGGIRTPVDLASLTRVLESRLEKNRALDELLPSGAEVFVVTAEGMAHCQDHPDDYALQRIFALVDGFRDLDSLRECSRFYEFFLREFASQCLDREFLKKTRLPELAGIRPDHLTPEKASSILPHFKSAVKYAVDAMRARENLALLYETLGDTRNAVLQFNFIGDALVRMRKPDQALEAYRRALDLRPDAVLVCDKIVRLHQDTAEQEILKNNTAEAVRLLEEALRTRPDDQAVLQRLTEVLSGQKDWKALAELCDRQIARSKRLGNPHVAVTTCRQILAHLPDHPLFQTKLINVHLDRGEVAEAAREMAVLARIYAKKGQSDRAIDLAEKIRRLRDGDATTLQVYRELATELGVRRGPRKRSAVLLGLVTGLAVVFCAYQALSYHYWSGIRAEGRAFAQAIERKLPAGSPGSSRLALGADSEEAHNLRLASRCESFVRQFPISFWRGEAENTGRLCREVSRSLGRARERAKKQLVERAESLALEGDGPAVMAGLEPLLALPQSDPWRSRAEEILRESKRFKRSARELAEEGRARELAQDWTGARESYARILKEYPHSRWRPRLRFPVVVESEPEGADVFQVVRGFPANRLGATPLVLRLERAAVREIEIVAPNHLPLRIEVEATGGERRRLHLERVPLGRLEIGAPLPVPPVFAGELVLTANDEGQVLAHDPRQRLLRWRLEREGLLRLVSSPIPVPEGVYLVWSDRTVQLIEPRDPLPAGGTPTPRVRRHVMLDGLATTRAVALESGVLAIGTSRNEIQVLHRKTLARAGRIPLEGRPLRLAPAGPDSVVAATEDGALVCAGISLRRVKWRKQLDSRPLLDPVRAGDSLLVVTPERDLFVLDPESGLPRQTLDLSDAEHVALAPGPRRVFAASHDGRIVALSSESGKAVAQRSADEPIVALAWRDGNLVILRERGRFLVADAGLSTRWAGHALADTRSVAVSAEYLIGEAAGERGSRAGGLVVFSNADYPPPGRAVESVPGEGPPAFSSDPASSGEPAPAGETPR